MCGPCLLYCNASGAPLSEIDLTSCDELAQRIREWILLKSKAAPSSSSVAASDESGGSKAVEEGARSKKAAAVALQVDKDDDMYDF